MTDPTHEYKSWISELKTRYKQAQIKASVAVNGELLKFYFDLGKDISEKQFANSYGSAFYKTLSSDLITEFSDAKGFSPTNLKYSFYFYDLYKAEFQNCPQVVDDLCRIPWGHHRFIIDKIKNDSKKALFYVEQIIQNNWSRNVLLNFIDSNLYERQGRLLQIFLKSCQFLQVTLLSRLQKILIVLIFFLSAQIMMKRNSRMLLLEI